MAWARKRSHCQLALTLLCGLLGACASTNRTISDRVRVEVEVVHPERFTDFGPRHGREEVRRLYADLLRSHMIGQASKRMRDGQALHISILDVDMAGRIEPWHREFYGRVMRNADPPRINLHFQLTARDGSILGRGARSLQDTQFLLHASTVRIDPLAYEKALLDRWLERELGAS